MTGVGIPYIIGSSMARINPFQPLYAVCNRESLVAKASRPKDFPIIIDIELTNRCNLHCLMCPTGIGTIKRPQGLMTDSVFDKIITELHGGKVGLRFIRWGEPLLHPKCSEFFKKAKDSGVLCHFNTNGHLLTEAMMRELLDISWDSVKFSFQGVDAQSYDAMRQSNVANGFETLLAKIRRFHELRDGLALPFIHVASTISYESAEMVARFKEEMARYADLVTVGRTQLDHIDINDIMFDEKTRDLLRGLSDKQSLVKARLKQCPEVFDKLSINWDGTVTACCKDYNGMMNLGDIQESSIKEIWEGDRLRAFRVVLAKCDYDALPLCRHCYDYMGLQSDNNKV